jgi:hypothetical protein
MPISNVSGIQKTVDWPRFNILRRPILASILSNRWLCRLISVAGIVQVSLTALALPAWQSPLHTLLGIPDPGCGLSRAIVALLRGDWQTALAFHAFAPLFVIALVAIAFGAILPDPGRNWLVDRIALVESRTGLTAMLLIALVIYWLARLFILSKVYIGLIAG